MPKAKITHGLDTAMLAEDAVKQALVDKFPGLAKLDADRNLTFRFYGSEHLIDVHAHIMSEEPKGMPRPNLLE